MESACWLRRRAVWAAPLFLSAPAPDVLQLIREGATPRLPGSAWQSPAAPFPPLISPTPGSLPAPPSRVPAPAGWQPSGSAVTPSLPFVPPTAPCSRGGPLLGEHVPPFPLWILFSSVICDLEAHIPLVRCLTRVSVLIGPHLS